MMWWWLFIFLVGANVGYWLRHRIALKQIKNRQEMIDVQVEINQTLERQNHRLRQERQNGEIP